MFLLKSNLRRVQDAWANPQRCLHTCTSARPPPRSTSRTLTLGSFKQGKELGCVPVRGGGKTKTTLFCRKATAVLLTAGG